MHVSYHQCSTHNQSQAEDDLSLRLYLQHQKTYPVKARVIFNNDSRRLSDQCKLTLYQHKNRLVNAGTQFTYFVYLHGRTQHAQNFRLGHWSGIAGIIIVAVDQCSVILCSNSVAVATLEVVVDGNNKCIHKRRSMFCQYYSIK